ncbi:MAG TPA: type II toxin-antitoxin system RelE/ParE family toxin, partial [Dehalococcoidales bacterium]|nr:type II toxin-antitoxin system RelE/ParE family toxin [Dehalococcoidales bacterium]
RKMAEYKVFFKVSVEKDLRQIPQKEIKKILSRINLLTADPRPPGCEKLTGQERYRVRQGRYRILYTIQDNELTIWVVKISHRKESVLVDVSQGTVAKG